MYDEGRYNIRSMIENMINPAVTVIYIVNSITLSSYIIWIEEFRLPCIFCWSKLILIIKNRCIDLRGNITSKLIYNWHFVTYNIVAISEHKLYEYQLPALKSHAKSSIHLNYRNVNWVAGFHGVGILWRNDSPLITNLLILVVTVYVFYS